MTGLQRSQMCQDSIDKMSLLDLPEDLLGQIAGYLPLEEQIRLFSVHPLLLSLAKSHSSPIPSTVRGIMAQSIPYPDLMAKLPSMTLYLPDNSDGMVLDILVRARPRWILERLEIPRWKDSLWKEAFERRFLPSWKRYKAAKDSWRAVFLRLLQRLEHRNTGCAHDEPWTRFVTLHRNGSASINRIYARNFDPYEIYDELKSQNNFSSQRTTVRVLLHLNDVRILVVGVLSSEPSIFVNPNAHLLLHPPLLRNTIPHRPSPPATPAVRFDFTPRPSHSRTVTGAVVPSVTTNEAYFPLVRSLSTSGPENTTYGLGESSSTSYSIPPTSPSILSTFAKVLPGRNKRSSSTSDSQDQGASRLGARLTAVRSRDSGDGDGARRRTFSFGRTRSGSQSTSQVDPTQAQDRASSVQQQVQATPAAKDQPFIAVPEDHAYDHEFEYAKVHIPPTPPHTPPPRPRIPYPRLRVPQPAEAFVDYPNYPTSSTSDEVAESNHPAMVERRKDRRDLHEEIEDEGIGAVWSAKEEYWPDGIKMAEWDPQERSFKRWVGPVLVIAQVHPPDREQARPQGSTAPHAEGYEPDLGPTGMYASLGFEDLEVIAPWLELRGGGGNSSEAKRSGLGFEWID